MFKSSTTAIGSVLYESGLQHDYAADVGLMAIVRGIGSTIFGGATAGAAAESAVRSLGPTTRGNVIGAAVR